MKLKAVTFSYDDGVTQDRRLIEIFNKYGLKATFNLNSELLGRDGSLIREGVCVSHKKLCPEDVRHVYSGHEVAAHTLTHPFLPAIEDASEIVRQVEEDRLRLSELAGYEVIGFAYPGGGKNYDERVAKIIKESTGIQYCRTTELDKSFDIQPDLYVFKPTLYHHTCMDELFTLGEKFLEMSTNTPKIFYIWGHAYEFDIHNTWDRFEDFCRMISGHSDVFYGTNREVLLSSD